MALLFRASSPSCGRRGYGFVTINKRHLPPL
jgi:hypothetical protein